MSERDEMRRRVFGTLLRNAVFRWESMITLLLTLVLFFGVGGFTLFGVTFPALVWLILGAGAEGILLWSTLTDPEETDEAMAREFESQYDLAIIRNNTSRERLRSAMDYRRNMLAMVKQHNAGMRVQFRETIAQVNDWIAAMYDLAMHIDNFESNPIVERDLKRVPDQIRSVRTRIELETDERVRGDLERQLKLLEQQQMNLQQTQNSVKRAEIQLESTLSSLGTVYAQMSLLGTKGGVDGSKQQRLRLEIQDEVNNLQDTIEAMEEVHMQSLRLQ
jgi:hypothetical protein